MRSLATGYTYHSVILERHKADGRQGGRPSSSTGDRLCPSRPIAMAHEIAKLLLEYAGTFGQRADAVQVAIDLGMPLNEVEDYLDWLDAVKPLPEEAEEQ